ncbi:hypothetical protein AF60_01630 [Streptococcus uberis S6261]|nr:hypothetical protein AF60_01630 [Streptococcus uberis S6261]KKF47495.1 hypothetical protein AF62_08655 [Streptococcus uberis C8329]
MIKSERKLSRSDKRKVKTIPITKLMTKKPELANSPISVIEVKVLPS